MPVEIMAAAQLQAAVVVLVLLDKPETVVRNQVRAVRARLILSPVLRSPMEVAEVEAATRQIAQTAVRAVRAAAVQAQRQTRQAAPPELQTQAAAAAAAREILG
jgi:hypothetical protein